MHECTQEKRLRALEDYKLINDIKFNDLLSRFDGLISILKKLSFIGIGIIISVLGSLLVYWVKG